MRPVPLFLLLCLIVAGFVSSDRATAAPVYRCVGTDGAVSFQDRPCKAGSTERRIEIVSSDPSPARIESARSRGRDPAPRAASSGRRLRSADPASYECRTQTGLLFYRHTRCPATLAVATINGKKERLPVSSRSISRREACQGMRKLTRDGDEFDDRPSTYDRNLGRDICRRY